MNAKLFKTFIELPKKVENNIVEGYENLYFVKPEIKGTTIMEIIKEAIVFTKTDKSSLVKFFYNGVCVYVSEYSNPKYLKRDYLLAICGYNKTDIGPDSKIELLDDEKQDIGEYLTRKYIEIGLDTSEIDILLRYYEPIFI